MFTSHFILLNVLISLYFKYLLLVFVLAKFALTYNGKAHRTSECTVSVVGRAFTLLCHLFLEFLSSCKAKSVSIN